MEGLFTTQNFVALVTLTVLEIVLGIDNVIFIAILAGRLPPTQQDLARKLGIGLAVVSRIMLLLGISWITRLTTPIFQIINNPISGRDLILLVGGMFLIGKSTYEIHEKLEAADHPRHQVAATTLVAVITQVIIIDVVFSLDSVITAIGMSNVLPVMILAILLAAAVMILFSGIIARFVEKHPTMKMLALSFLILIGAMLVVEGWNPDIAHDLHLRNYIYFAMAFSFMVELINMRVRRTEPVQLHNQPTLPASTE